jgi:hypothetical protein
LECSDVSSFVDRNRKVRDCSWVLRNKTNRCPKYGDECPVSCDICRGAV